MNHLLRPRIWTFFLASSGVGPYDVPFRYDSEPIPRYRGTVARWHPHLRGLATAIHETSGLALHHNFGHIARKLKHINAPTTIPPRNIIFAKAPFVCMILAGIPGKN